MRCPQACITAYSAHVIMTRPLLPSVCCVITFLQPWLLMLSQVLTPADEIHHINKHNFKVPFVCGCRDLGEALRRIAEGAAMIRTKGEAGTGNVVEAVRHARAVMGAIRQLQTMDDDELYVYAKEIRAPVELVRQTKHLGRLPVVNFAAGGVATPADAALMMQLGMDGVFVGSGIFKSGDPASRARAIVQVGEHHTLAGPRWACTATASVLLQLCVVGVFNCVYSRSDLGWVTKWALQCAVQHAC